MARISRMLVSGEKAVYHVMSYTALQGYPMQDLEKETLLRIIKRFSCLYLTEIMGFCLMGNHFHLLVKMLPDADFSNSDIRERLKRFYGNERIFTDEQLPYFRLKLASLSEFIRDIKVNFARYYNRRHNRRGYFWGDRFKSVIVDKGKTLINCLSYIDLNPVRAGIVKQPEAYRWCSIAYHLQTHNKDRFLSTDFGLREFNVMSEKQRIRSYREHVYEAGAIDRKGEAAVIDARTVKKQRQKGYKITRVDRFRNRTRYFTDGGIIGSKAFVSANYQRFKHLFQSAHEKRPNPIKGLSGMYALKKLSENH